ncbi:hypothetical protein Poli38472_009756 [Pythium oligandrum]|uniref:Uncharacterized protein n=1 Tax=Pythium oligandrum TaxID=41045 RepID=A0A8K1FL23_PYTOL|nr:hypothetical protein Poli38472_009756 [Pythium oligandrum]|eukprot:TMW62263.1 hypothetical protein Poli38472_009756 [Pythium oligandrum]
MKALKIKNRCESRLFFAFCTISSCKCSICESWIKHEKKPIVGLGAATYGYVQVEPFSERVERFCDKWQCIGACFFDSMPQVIKKEMLVRFNEEKNYKVGNGRGKLRFTHTPEALLAQPGFLHIQNFGCSTLYFVFSVVSKCECAVCQQWINREEFRAVDSEETKYGYFQVNGLGERIEHVCGQWNCVGACIFNAMPETIKKAMLLAFDKSKGYMYGNDRAKVHFTDTPEVGLTPTKPEATRPPNCIHVQNLGESTLFFAFCTTAWCKCDVCQSWLKLEKTPVVDLGRATYGYFQLEAFGHRVDHFCDTWSFIGACFFDALPETMEKELLLEFDKRKSYSFGSDRAKLRFIHAPTPPKYVHVQNLSGSTLYFAFSTVSECRCENCQQWIQLERLPLNNAQWRVGRFVVEPHKAHSVRTCDQWECVGACFLDAWPLELSKAQFGRFDRRQNYRVAGGKAKLCFANEQKSPQSRRSNQEAAVEVEIVGAGAMTEIGLELLKIGIEADPETVAESVNTVVEVASSCVIS